MTTSWTTLCRPGRPVQRELAGVDGDADRPFLELQDHARLLGGRVEQQGVEPVAGDRADRLGPVGAVRLERQLPGTVVHHPAAHGQPVGQHLVGEPDALEGVDAPCRQGEVDRPAAGAGRARVRTAFVQRDVVAAARQEHRQQRPGEAGSGDADVSHRHRSRGTRRRCHRAAGARRRVQTRRADGLPDVLLAQRERVVGAEQHRRRAHHVDEVAQRPLVVHRRVDLEAVEVGARRRGRSAADEVATVPRVLQPAEQERERAATVGEADAQVGGEPVERAAEDHPVERQLRLGRHGDRPGEHPVFQPAAAEHVPRVHEDRGTERGAMGEERDEAIVVEVTVTDVVADLHALHPVGEAALELLARQVGVLQRDLADRHEPAVAGRAQLEEGVVEDAGALHRLLGGATVGEQHRRRRHHLDVDAVAIHVGKAHRRVPAGRRHRTELPVADHDGGPVGAVAPHPRPVRRAEALVEVGPGLREEVGVEIDDHNDLSRGVASGASGGSGIAPRPGWTQPQPGHVRARSSS